MTPVFWTCLPPNSWRYLLKEVAFEGWFITWLSVGSKAWINRRNKWEGVLLLTLTCFMKIGLWRSSLGETLGRSKSAKFLGSSWKILINRRVAISISSSFIFFITLKIKSNSAAVCWMSVPRTSCPGSHKTYILPGSFYQLNLLRREVSGDLELWLRRLS